MLILNKQKILLLFAFCLIFSTSEVLACVCALNTNENINEAVKKAVKQSTVIFSGKVVGVEYRKGIPNEYMESRNKQTDRNIEYKTLVIKFQVERAWKGKVKKEIFLFTDQTKNSDGSETSTSCDINFRLNESYLIYGFGKENELKTSPCTRTSLLAKTLDLKILGKGKEPIEKKHRN